MKTTVKLRRGKVSTAPAPGAAERLGNALATVIVLCRDARPVALIEQVALDALRAECREGGVPCPRSKST